MVAIMKINKRGNQKLIKTLDDYFKQIESQKLAARNALKRNFKSKDRIYF